MSETLQNIKCNWSGCAHRFGSEIDMNMHVMMNHLVLLEYGDFVLKKPLVSRKRPMEVVRGASPEILEVPVVRQLTANVKVEPRASEDFRAPESVKKPNITVKPDSSSSARPYVHVPPIPIPPNLDIPVQSPQVAQNLQRFIDYRPDEVVNVIEMDSDVTNQNREELRNEPIVSRKRPTEVVGERSQETSGVPIVRQFPSNPTTQPGPSEALRAPESAPEVPIKKPNITVKPDSSSSFQPVTPIPIPPNLEFPIGSPQVAQNLQHFIDYGVNLAPNVIEMDSDASLQNGDELGVGEVQEQLDAMMGVPQKLSQVIDDFLERLRPMKQLGFIRENRTTYCLVCLKYVKSFHECNWKHTPAEDRIAEMWYRRFGKERPNGKNQLMKELLEVKTWILEEEEAGNLQDIDL